MRGLIQRILREPLIHFLVLGGLIFAANALLHPAPPDPHEVVIGKADIERIRALYAQQWGAEPNAADMPGLIDNYVRSEILFREGASLGLATDDSVVRNRVTQKMEFLLQDTSSVPQPTEAEMQAYLAAHAAAYRVPERLVFRQIYFSPSQRGGAAEGDAKKALQSMTAPATDAPPPGDPFMLSPDPTPRSQDEIAKDFGPDFATALFMQPVGSWQGPIRSAFGFHLVEVTERLPAELPPLAELRNRVHDDLMVERFRAASDAAYARVKARYHVVMTPGAMPRPAMAASTP